MSRGKKYKSSIAQFDRQELYSAGDAIDLVKATSKASFDETALAENYVGSVAV